MENRDFQLYVAGFRDYKMPESSFNTRYVAVPYLGVVSTGGNNFGIFEAKNYPFTPLRTKKITVGLFGGSVAEQELLELRGALENDSYVKALKDLGFEISLVNLAVESSRQPQQLHTAMYFLDKVDVFINLDGNNETLLDPGTNFPADFPLMTDSSFFFSEAKLDRLRDLYWLTRAKYFLLQPLFDGDFFFESNVGFLIFRPVRRYLQRQIWKIQSEMKQSGNPIIISGPGAEVRSKQLVQTWSKYSRLQNFLVKKHGKSQIFFIQPVPYLRGTKALSGEEMKLLSGMDPAQIDWSERQYAALRKEAEILNNSGGKVFDLSFVFKDVGATLYVDSCCHLNSEGKKILAEQMLPPIIESIKSVQQKNNVY
jgi:hypothetical protein